MHYFDKYELTALRKIIRSGGNLDHNTYYPTVLNHTKHIITDFFEALRIEEAKALSCWVYNDSEFLYYKIYVPLSHDITLKIDTGGPFLMTTKDAMGFIKSNGMIQISFYDCAMNWIKYPKPNEYARGQFLYEWIQKNITHQKGIPVHGEHDQGVHLASN